MSRYRPTSDSGVFFAGNFISGSIGTQGPSEELASFLEKERFVCRASSKRNAVFKLCDMLRTAWRFRNRYSTGVVEVYSGRAFLWAEIISWFLSRMRKRIILVLHGGNLPLFAARHGYRVRRLLAAAHAIVYPSGFLSDAMGKYRPSGPVERIIPNGMRLKKYHFRPRSSAAPALIWIRAFHRIYNPQLVPAVAALLAKDLPDVQITMVGPAKDKSLQETRALISHLGLSKNVHIIEGVARDEIPALLDKADIFLNTAGIDNAPVSVCEAMAAGLCIVSTSVGGIPYIVKDGAEGILIKPGDAEAMAEAVRRIIREPGLAGRLSSAARRKAEAFDWTHALPEWNRLLGCGGET